MATQQASSAEKSAAELISTIDQAVRKQFDANKRILAFDEYVALLAAQPEQQLRGSARYVLDMLAHFGSEPVIPAGTAAELGLTPLARFKLFNGLGERSPRRVSGQEPVQHHIERSLQGFVQQGYCNRLLLLHGPNGSAKSSIIQALMAGMEQYSALPTGASYTFNWVFPIDKVTKGSMGIGGGASGAYAARGRDASLTSFAHLGEEDIQSRFSCELKDHPLLLIPVEQRAEFVNQLLGKSRGERAWRALPHALSRGDLCHRCKLISEALLATYQGDFRKVLQHVQVERFFFSRRYRKGLATVEPQMHVDASYQQLTLNRSMGALPSALQGLNLFSIGGDLVDGNRGIVEYSDLLKRPMDTFKYLLTACETGSINIGPTTAQLDTVMLGSTNEVQLDAFKEFPDFVSFKARIDLIRVPYLLRVREEQEIYQADLDQIATLRPVAPHTSWALALWAVLTRLKKPNSINYAPEVSSLISALHPLEKAKLYDSGELPAGLSAEDRKRLRGALKRVREEYSAIPYYEGRLGASAREMKSILYAAAQNPEYSCLSPLPILREMEEFIKRVTEYEFLKQDVKDGYHDVQAFIETVRAEYLIKIDHEVRSSIGLYDDQQWEEFIRKYVLHLSLHLKKEKYKNPITGQLEDPDSSLVEEFEAIIGVPASAAAGGAQGEGGLEAFRQNIISQVGAWALDHPGQPVAYSAVFPEFFGKLEKHYFESQRSVLTQMHRRDTEEGKRLAERTIAQMCSRFGHTPESAEEAIGFLMRSKYSAY